VPKALPRPRDENQSHEADDEPHHLVAVYRFIAEGRHEEEKGRQRNHAGQDAREGRGGSCLGQRNEEPRNDARQNTDDPEMPPGGPAAGERLSFHERQRDERDGAEEGAAKDDVRWCVPFQRDFYEREDRPPRETGAEVGAEDSAGHAGAPSSRR